MAKEYEFDYVIHKKGKNCKTGVIKARMMSAAKKALEEKFPDNDSIKVTCHNHHNSYSCPNGFIS